MYTASFKHFVVLLVMDIKQSMNKPLEIDPIGNPAAAFQQIKLEEGTPEGRTKVHKEKGNDLFMKKKYHEAVEEYSEGIKQKSSDVNMNAVLYCNRATAQFYLGNYSSSVQDATKSRELKPDHIKAYVRGTNGCLELINYTEAIEWCDSGLQVEPTNQRLQELRKKAVTLKNWYHIKWTQLANLPAPMLDAVVAVLDKKIYVAGGHTPVDDAFDQVFVYDINADYWSWLPPPGHYYGIPHIIGGRLAIIGGRPSYTNIVTNKVSTFDETSQTWTSYYPNLLSVRDRPGVASHLDHVIVAGGLDNSLVVQDDIEILNWKENSCWKKISITLPVPMSIFAPIVVDDYLFIGDCTASSFRRARLIYKIPVIKIIGSVKSQPSVEPIPLQSSILSVEPWVIVTGATHWSTALVPSSSPLVVVGGSEYSGRTTTSDIMMYDDSSKSWKNIGSLSFPRASVAIAALNDNAIIVIGGYTNGGDIALATSSSLTTVEVGQFTNQ